MANVDAIMYQLIDQINKKPEWRPIYDALTMLARNQDQVRDRTGGDFDNTAINTSKIASNTENITLNAAAIAENALNISDNTARIEVNESNIEYLEYQVQSLISRNRLLEQLIYELTERYDSGT
jgi:anaerobic ribonucleoside-triphosphate reductase